MYDVPFNGKLRQFLVAIIANLLSISYGISCGWPSPVIPQLRSDQPPIGNGPMTEEEISWIGGLLPIGALMIVPFCGILVEGLGRKNFALLTGLPHIVSWLLVLFAPNYIYLYAARLIIGIGGGMALFVVSIYVSEIASEDIRGVLGSLFALTANSGVLFAYVVGAFLPYRIFASLCLIFPVAFVATISFMPETPVYLVRRNRLAEAYNSLTFLRGNNRSLVELELSRLQRQVSETAKTAGLWDCFKDKATRKGLMISLGLFSGQQHSGIFAMICYAETIFERAGSSVSSETAPIIIGVTLLIGSYMSTMLMDRAGRRSLTLVSCFGMAISHTFVGLFFHLQLSECEVSSISWLPLVGLTTYIVTYVLGMGVVPFVVVSELFHLDVSNLATTLSFLFFWAMGFASVKIFGLAMDSLGADGCFFMLASFCAASFVFAYCLLPETKGRKREDIVNELAGIVTSCREKGCANDKQVGGIKDQSC